nr:MAG TPA: hypothetical protein [Caudoviricetes sp.]
MVNICYIFRKRERGNYAKMLRAVGARLRECYAKSVIVLCENG